MKYVGVRHAPNQTSLYWFSVPEELLDYITVGTKVICDTRKGKTEGTVERVLDGFSEGEAKQISGNRYPFKSVVGAMADYGVANIHIPWEMEASTPSPDKICCRMGEFYSTGTFKTKIVIAADGTLLDGYTAYLVAKMFGHDSLRVLMKI